MIFVTVGGSDIDFSRLIQKMDDIAKNISEEIIMQIGHTHYKPKHAQFFCFKNKDEIEEFYKKSRIIVSHAGIGSILTAVKLQKPIIVVPRRKEYGELFDNHQVEITDKLKKQGLNVFDHLSKLNEEKIQEEYHLTKFQSKSNLING